MNGSVARLTIPCVHVCDSSDAHEKMMAQVQGSNAPSLGRMATSHQLPRATEASPGPVVVQQKLYLVIRQV